MIRIGALLSNPRLALIPALALALLWASGRLDARTPDQLIAPPQPAPAQRAARPARPTAAEATAERLKLVNATKSWGYQLVNSKLEELLRSPYDLLVLDATTGLANGRHFRREEVSQLRRKPDGGRRLVVSYLSIGEAEDYRPDYFTAEYMSEDAPDWLLHENPDWKGNRLIRFCSEGWQKTILGDGDGRSVYNSLDPSPLYRLIELGFDGVYLDRVDVYEEVGKDCPNAQARMVEFVARLAAHARRRNPHFMVILQNAEDLLKQSRVIDAIDAVAKESLFHGWGGGGGSNRQSISDAASVRWSVERLELARKAGRAVFVVDYPKDRAAAEVSLRRITELGYVPYVAPKDLGRLWLPGANF